ncbi:hypothetical protein ACFLUV_01230 [Elusimicrobiota bacterium]
MRYLELRNNLKDYKIFSLSDIKQLDINFHRRRLNEWQEKDYILKVVKGYYIFKDTDINDTALYCIANRIYAPSYISLEMALSHYNLIPESVYSITSVSSRRKYRFDTKLGEFQYRAVKPELFFGYKIIKENNITYKIADLEKAILDYLYLNPHYTTIGDFSEFRINKEIFWENVDEQKLNKYLDRFAQKKLSVRMKKLLRYLKND